MQKYPRFFRRNIFVGRKIFAKKNLVKKVFTKKKFVEKNFCKQNFSKKNSKKIFKIILEIFLYMKKNSVKVRLIFGKKFLWLFFF